MNQEKIPWEGEEKQVLGPNDEMNPVITPLWYVNDWLIAESLGFVH